MGARMWKVMAITCSANTSAVGRLCHFVHRVMGSRWFYIDVQAVFACKALCAAHFGRQESRPVSFLKKGTVTATGILVLGSFYV